MGRSHVDTDPIAYFHFDISVLATDPVTPDVVEERVMFHNLNNATEVLARELRDLGSDFNVSVEDLGAPTTQTATTATATGTTTTTATWTTSSNTSTFTTATATTATTLTATTTVTTATTGTETTVSTGIATTTTTTSAPDVGCSLVVMVCPLPADVPDRPYEVQGAAPPDACGMHRSGTRRYFTVTVAECNVRLTEVPGGVNLSVTLVPATGGVIFADETPPTIVCSCFYDTFAEVGTNPTVGLAPETVREEHAGEGGGFNASLHLFPDDSFSQPLLPGETYPIASDRFYFEITAGPAGTVIGVPDCMLTPTGEADSVYRFDLRSDYCDDPIFEAVQLSGPGVDNATAQVRWSTIMFRFATYSKVYISCTVVLCDSVPCGTCGGRRLGQRRRLQAGQAEQSDSALAAFDFVLPPGDYLELPGRELPGPGAAPETPDDIPAAAIIAVVATTAVLVAAAAGIGVVALWRLKMRDKATGTDASDENYLAVEDEVHQTAGRPRTSAARADERGCRKVSI